LLVRANSFLKQRPVAIERPEVEELDAALIGLERAGLQAAHAHAQQVAAHLFLGQAIRRTAIMGGQPTDRVDVDCLRSNRQPADFMSSIIRNRNGVIEVSLGSRKPALWPRPLEGYTQLRRPPRCTLLQRSRSV